MRIRSLIGGVGFVCVLTPLIVSCSGEKSVAPSTGNIFCSGGQSVYLCATDVSGSRETILFQDSNANDIASISTVDDFGNPYCVTARSDGTGYFYDGSCEVASNTNDGATLTPELTRACDAVRALINWAESQPIYDPFETGVQVRQVAGLFSAAGKTATAEMMNGEATIYMSFGGMGAMSGMPAKVLVRECQTNADADGAYDQPVSTLVDSIPAEVSVVVNCSGLTFDDDLPIGPCSEGYGVSMIQNSLISYGYQIEPDGQYGQATADAVSQFQGVKGLTITGTVDVLTYAALGPMGVGTDLNGDGVVGPNETIGD